MLSCLFYSTFFVINTARYRTYTFNFLEHGEMFELSPSWITMNKHDITEYHFISLRNHLWFAFLEIESRSWNKWTQFRQIFMVSTVFFIAFVVFMLLARERILPLTLMEHFTVILSFQSLKVGPKQFLLKTDGFLNRTNSDIRSVIKQITGLKVKTKKVSKANFQGFFSEEVRHDVRIHLGHAVTYKTVGKCIWHSQRHTKAVLSSSWYPIWT